MGCEAWRRDIMAIAEEMKGGAEWWNWKDLYIYCDSVSKNVPVARSSKRAVENHICIGMTKIAIIGRFMGERSKYAEQLKIILNKAFEIWIVLKESKIRF